MKQPTLETLDGLNKREAVVVKKLDMLQFLSNNSNAEAEKEYYDGLIYRQTIVLQNIMSKKVSIQTSEVKSE